MMFRRFEPLDASPWVAMSALQKAIRRGRKELALRSAATLLRDSPERFWRRAGVIAFEDIGIADLECVSLVTHRLAGKTFRAQLGGEWRVASFVTTLMAHARKSRAADDLLVVSERDPDFKPARERARVGTPGELA